MNDFTYPVEESKAKKVGRPRKTPAPEPQTDDVFVLPDGIVPVPKKKKLRQEWLQSFLISMLEYSEEDLGYPKPNAWVAVYTDDKGERYPIVIDHKTKVAKEMSWTFIRSEILYLSKSLAYFEPLPFALRSEYHWVESQVEACFKLWRRQVAPYKKPKPWAFKSDRDIAFIRHSFDPDPSFPTPKFDEFICRIEDGDTFMAHVGGIFVPDSVTQQYFYLQGDGGEGKSAMARFLCRVLGKECFPASRPIDNQFFGAMFEGKRLVYFTDLRNPKFLLSDVFTNLTGGDGLQVERKGKDVESGVFSGTLIINSNLNMTIANIAHDLRRVLYSFVNKLPPDVAVLGPKEYDDMLWAEAPGIIGKCIEAYRRRRPNNEPLVQSQAIQEKIKSFARDPIEEEFEDFFEAHFTFSPDGRTLVNTVNTWLENRRWGDSKQTAFRKWLQNNKGCRRQGKKIAGKVIKFWFGFSEGR